jgi:hypothetical protein
MTAPSFRSLPGATEQDEQKGISVMEDKHPPTGTAAPGQFRGDFDAWLANPYTKVLQKSITDDYVPRADVAALASQPVAQPAVAWRFRPKGADGWVLTLESPAVTPISERYEVEALGVIGARPVAQAMEAPKWLRCEFCKQLGCANPAAAPAQAQDEREKLSDDQILDLIFESGLPPMVQVQHSAALITMLRRAALSASTPPAPIDMVLHCPKCGKQHIDAPEMTWKEALEATGRSVPPEAEEAHGRKWTNRPHRSHLCHGCGHIWRPADVPTNGVQAVKTTGKADSPVASTPPAELPVAYLHSIPHPDWLDVCSADTPGAFPLFATPPAAVPEGQKSQDGWKLVPLILTSDMVSAFYVGTFADRTADAVWRAMLKAAPEAGKDQSETERDRKLVEAGFHAAMQCHAHHGMSGWVTHDEQYIEEAMKGQSK